MIMRLIDKILVCLGAMTVGLALDIFSLIFDYMNLFSLGTLIIAISIGFIAVILYIELEKYKNINDI